MSQARPLSKIRVLWNAWKIGEHPNEERHGVDHGHLSDPETFPDFRPDLLHPIPKNSSVKICSHQVHYQLLHKRHHHSLMILCRKMLQAVMTSSPHSRSLTKTERLLTRESPQQRLRKYQLLSRILFDRLIISRCMVHRERTIENSRLHARIPLKLNSWLLSKEAPLNANNYPKQASLAQISTCVTPLRQLLFSSPFMTMLLHSHLPKANTTADHRLQAVKARVTFPPCSQARRRRAPSSHPLPLQVVHVHINEERRPRQDCGHYCLRKTMLASHLPQTLLDW